jgi:hypothetical protein
MSRSARRSRQRRRTPFYGQLVEFEPGRVSSLQAMLVAARAAGCTCAPDIVLSDVDKCAGIYHDSWCALLRRRDLN